jgi:hypothetical protein
MRHSPILVAAGLSLLASVAVAAPRQDAKLADFAQRMFATKALDQKTSACFVRTYDAAHLARHRKQTVTAMKMLVSAEKLADDGQLSYSYELGMNFRDRRGDYVSSFECGHARASEQKRGGVDIRCHGDGCEGGDGVVIALAPDSKAIMVRIDSVYLRNPDKPKDSDDEYFNFEGGADNRVFRLERADPDQCKSLIREGDEVAVLQPE